MNPSNASSRPTQQTTDSAVEIASASGLVVRSFTVVDLAASLTASKLYRVVGGAASVVGRQVPVIPAFRGYIGALTLSSDTPKSAGVATFVVYKDGVATGALLTWNNVASQIATFEKNKYGFTPGQSIDIRATTDASFAPATADIIVEAWLVATTEAATT